MRLYGLQVNGITTWSEDVQDVHGAMKMVDPERVGYVDVDPNHPGSIVSLLNWGLNWGDVTLLHPDDDLSDLPDQRG